MTSSDGMVRKMEKFDKTLRKASDKGVSIKVIVPTQKDVEKLDKEFKNVLESKASSDTKSRFVLWDSVLVWLARHNHTGKIAPRPRERLCPSYISHRKKF